MTPKSYRGDRVWTPEWVVSDIVRFLQPTGIVLEPFRGGGAFTRQFPEWLWCEIDDGRDFFDWDQPVDWIVSNPPYSKLRPVWMHAATVSANIAFLIPFRNWVSGYGFIRATMEYGNPKDIRLYGTGSRCGFPMGNAIVAVHWARGYRGQTRWSDATLTRDEA